MFIFIDPVAMLRAMIDRRDLQRALGSDAVRGLDSDESSQFSRLVKLRDNVANAVKVMIREPAKVLLIQSTFHWNL